MAGRFMRRVVIRIPVELTLFWLSQYHLVPKAMTFEGRNFDIFTGLSAPLIYYFGFVRKTLSTRLIIAWNWVGIALLLFVVSTAVRSALSEAAGDQAGAAIVTQPLAITRFPWALLPGFLVPAVLVAHFITLRRLREKNIIPLLS